MLNRLNEIFLFIYEKIFGIYEVVFDDVYRILYENNTYGEMGLAVITFPILFWVYFYFYYKNPYAKNRHWILCWLIQVGATVFVAYGVLVSNYYALSTDPIFYIEDETTRELTNNHIAGLFIKYGLANIVLSALTGYVWTLLLRSWSTHQVHLSKI
ncbi:MAG: hypothetical protein OXE77_08545 [Flavobacteriaceae bacterium]|nr:hypothetical protein [Flavobacteriaceae bacterium]MCY4267264.1 hypothetical protein [Flavobacteriaceae bacterium]